MEPLRIALHFENKELPVSRFTGIFFEFKLLFIRLIQNSLPP